MRSKHIESDDEDNLQSHKVFQQQQPAQSQASEGWQSTSSTPAKGDPSSATKRSVLKSAKSSHSSPFSSTESNLSVLSRIQGTNAS